ncbi:hypothetical protein [Streptomyces avermitilis]|uniref:hypothetical protein n=1 Tax=Streptomyces avermitilis TaxID=33903 RepID=UPI0037F65F1F
MLSVDPPWRRSLTVFSRVPPSGAAAAFVELLRRHGVIPAAPAEAYEDGAARPGGCGTPETARSVPPTAPLDAR